MPDYKKAFEILSNYIKYDIEEYKISNEYTHYTITLFGDIFRLTKEEYECIKECLEYKEKSWYMENKADLEESKQDAKN